MATQTNNNEKTGTSKRYAKLRKHFDMFENYTEIEARFDSIGRCDHEIATGNRVGWHPERHITICTRCWDYLRAMNETKSIEGDPDWSLLLPDATELAAFEKSGSTL